MAWYFECLIQCFSAAFDGLIKILESYRPQIPTGKGGQDREGCQGERNGGRLGRCGHRWRVRYGEGMSARGEELMGEWR